MFKIMFESSKNRQKKRQPLAQQENEDLDCLLDAVEKAQSTKYNTAYFLFVYEGKRF